MATQLPQVTGTAAKRPLDDLQDDCNSCDTDVENIAKKLKTSPQLPEDNLSPNENALQTSDKPNEEQNQQMLEIKRTETSTTLCESPKSNKDEISAALCENLKMNAPEFAQALSESLKVNATETVEAISESLKTNATNTAAAIRENLNIYATETASALSESLQTNATRFATAINKSLKINVAETAAELRESLNANAIKTTAALCKSLKISNPETTPQAPCKNSHTGINETDTALCESQPSTSGQLARKTPPTENNQTASESDDCGSRVSRDRLPSNLQEEEAIPILHFLHARLGTSVLLCITFDNVIDPIFLKMYTSLNRSNKKQVSKRSHAERILCAEFNSIITLIKEDIKMAKTMNLHILKLTLFQSNSPCIDCSLALQKMKAAMITNLSLEENELSLHFQIQFQNFYQFERKKTRRHVKQLQNSGVHLATLNWFQFYDNLLRWIIRRRQKCNTNDESLLNDIKVPKLETKQDIIGHLYEATRDMLVKLRLEQTDRTSKNILNLNKLKLEPDISTKSEPKSTFSCDLNIGSKSPRRESKLTPSIVDSSESSSSPSPAASEPSLSPAASERSLSPSMSESRSSQLMYDSDSSISSPSPLVIRLQ